jgi:hypothetical protein
MLIANYSIINKLCGHNHSGITNPLKWISPHVMRGYYTYSDLGPNSEQIKRDSFPTGTNPPYSLIMGDKGGLLSSTTTVKGNGYTTLGSLALGRSIEADLTGLGGLTASAAAIITMTAALTALGILSGASASGAVSAAVNITSSSSVTSSLNSIIKIYGDLTGVGQITSDLKGKGTLEAHIFVNQSEATTQELAAAVWNALTIQFNNPGTMGEAMAAAGSAGDPWITNLPGAYGAGSAGNILGNILTTIPDSVWDELKTAHTIDNSYGKIIQDLEDQVRKLKTLLLALT